MAGVCYTGTPTASNDRPNIQIGYCGGTANPANYTYQWSPAATVSNPNIQNPTTIPPGSPSYQVIVTDIAGGCSDTAVVVIQNSVTPPDPTIILPSQTFYCINDPAIAISTVTAGGVWTGNGINVAGLFTPSIAGVGNHELLLLQPIICKFVLPMRHSQLPLLLRVELGAETLAYRLAAYLTLLPRVREHSILFTL
jgi:hypothetical protein